MSDNLNPTNYTVNIQSLWEKYEDIAMHFNDLLMRLHTQGLAGIAAVSTLVGIFTKGTASDFQSDWLVATFIFALSHCFGPLSLALICFITTGCWLEL
jgi:hypothetical protein